jgi:mono/diheme cytochrome c family protein
VNVATRRIFVYAVVPLALFALWAWKTGYLWPEPSLDPNPLAIARGEEVFKGRCLQCHEAIPIAPRVAGWTVEYAYDAIAHLPELRPAMPPFQGTEQERADLAVYLFSRGATVSPEEAAAALGLQGEGEAEWEPPRFAPAQGLPDPRPVAPAAGDSAAR